MKKILLHAVCFVWLTGPALADAEVYNWSGFYAGVNGGYAGGSFGYPISISGGGIVANASFDFPSSGFLGGIQTGYNFQSGNWVGGFETDIQVSAVEGRLDLSTLGMTPPDFISTQVNWFGTVRPRIGYAFERLLLFGTGGFAFGETTISDGVDGIAVGRTGFTAGGGAEIGVTEKFSLKFQYDYVDFGTRSLVSGSLFGVSFDVGSRVSFHTGRFGLNWHF